MKYKIGFRFFVIYFLGIIFAILFKTAVCALPDDHIKRNLELSANEIEKAGIYPKVGLGYGEWTAQNQIDFCTEYELLISNYVIDGNRPFMDAMVNPGYGGNGNQAERFKAVVLEHPDADITKEQYWWGIQVILRPLLLFFTYDRILAINQIVFYALLAVVLMKMHNKLGAVNSILFIISLLMMKLSMVTMTLISSATYIIALITILYVLKCRELNRMKYAEIFLAAGLLTAFFDWFSTPIVTVSLPLAILLMKNRMTDRKCPFIDGMMDIFVSSLAWCAGYGGMLASKWLLLRVLLSESAIGDIASGRIREGMHNKVPWAPENDWEYLIQTVFDNNLYQSEMVVIFGKGSFVVLFLFLFVGILYLWREKSFHDIKDIGLLFLVSCMPIVWWFVFQGHSFVHGWFTYRSGAAVYLGVLFSIGICITRRKRN